MTFDLDGLVRKNIRDLKPYSSARSEFAGTAEIFLDANENAFGSPAGPGFNRYPDPLQTELKGRIAAIKNVDPSQIFVGNGSDEAIDLLYRIFCEPGRDAAIVCPPTYGMYRVSAHVNDVAVREIPLTPDFQLDVSAILSAVDETTKLIFICSPNNPTGNVMSRLAVTKIAENFGGIVVVDEAYIDFADEPSMISELGKLPNLVILQTFSKAWAMAGLRVGLAFAASPIIELLSRVKPPYNVSGIAQQAVIAALDDGASEIAGWIKTAKTERESMALSLSDLPFVRIVYPSDANFLLARVTDAVAIYRLLLDEGIVVRDRSQVELREECLRITVGTAEDNDRLLKALRRFGLSEK